METPGRKSNRRRQPNKKYSIDAFEGLEVIEGVDDHDQSKSMVGGLDDDEDDDFHFDPEASPEPPDNLSVDGEEEDQLAPDTGFDDAESVVGGSEVEGPLSPPGRKNKPDLKKAKHDSRYCPRGLLEPAARGSKELQRLYFFGPSKDDQAPAIQAHFKWGTESTIPSRKPNSGGFGGLGPSYFHKEETVKAETEEGWKWYEAEGGRETFNGHQLSMPLSSQDAQSYIISDTKEKCRLLMGPYKHQRLFEIGVNNSISLNDAWVPPPPSKQDPRSARNGWMLNLGSKIQQTEWVPHRESTRQFLTVSTSHLTGFTPDEKPFNAPSAPAFTPRPPTKSAIQIWEFRATGAEDRIDMNFPPKLRKLVCTEWGDVKQFKWCPMPRKLPSNQTTGRTNLGLLAGIWGDGVLRVLDIFIDEEEDADTEYELIKSSAFSAKPPQTICTCLAWLSSYSLVAGCANGYVGIWHLPSALRERSSSTTEDQSQNNAEPVLFSAISTTYLLEITTCYPSKPNLLLTSSMSGYIQMTDIMELSSKATMSPSATIRASRSRLGRPILLWHDFSQVVMSVDDNYTLVAYPVRRFFRQISFTRYKSSAMCVAISPVHPFVMAGCVGGEVITNNPLRRAYESKVPIWNQIWFTHEWTKARPSQNPASNTVDTDGDLNMTEDSTETHGSNTVQNSTPQGLSRILEGYKCKEIKLFNTEDAFQHRENGAVYSTVYDLKQSITSMAWNPNLHVGGWIAAGIANGLLRVENMCP